MSTINSDVKRSILEKVASEQELEEGEKENLLNVW